MEYLTCFVPGTLVVSWFALWTSYLWLSFFVRFVMWKRRSAFIQYYRWYHFTVDVLVLNIILINVVVNMSLLKRRSQQRIWTSVCFMQFFRMSTKTIRTKALLLHYIEMEILPLDAVRCGCVQCTFALFQLNARSICNENTILISFCSGEKRRSLRFKVLWSIYFNGVFANV